MSSKCGMLLLVQNNDDVTCFQSRWLVTFTWETNLLAVLHTCTTNHTTPINQSINRLRSICKVPATKDKWRRSSIKLKKKYNYNTNKMTEIKKRKHWKRGKCKNKKLIKQCTATPTLANTITHLTLSFLFTVGDINTRVDHTGCGGRHSSGPNWNLKNSLATYKNLNSENNTVKHLMLTSLVFHRQQSWCQPVRRDDSQCTTPKLTGKVTRI